MRPGTFWVNYRRGTNHLTSPVDISPVHLKTVQDILRENLPSGVTVWVFGSRASWATGDSSDLDLALEGDVDHDTILALEMAFEESSLPYTVDIIALNQISNSFRRIVDAQKVIFSITKDKTNTENNWHMASLKDIVDLRISGVDKKTKNGEHLVQLCNYTDVYNNIFIYADMDFMKATATEHEISKCLLSNGDVIITNDSEKCGDIGVPALVREDIPNLVCGYHLAILRPTPKIDGTYLYYALNTDEAQHQFQSYANGITRFGLRKADIGLVQIPRPPLDEQRSISHILRTIDDKIALNRRITRTLEEMARTLFKSWFVDFYPVCAKMEGRWRPGESLPGLPAPLYDLFPSELVDSELGEMPKGWEAKPLDEIADYRNGLALQNFRPKKNESKLPVVKIAQLRRGHTDGKEWAKEDITSECIIDNDDVIFSRSGSLMVKIWCGGRAALNQHLFKVTSTIYPKWFYFYWLNWCLPEFQSIVTSKATTMGHIKRHHLHDIRCIVPNLNLLNQIDHIFSNLLSQRTSYELQGHTLVNLRNVLLPKLISGEICISHLPSGVV